MRGLSFRWLKAYMPRGLYGRAALILVLPVVVVQLVVSVVFIQRHYEGVARQMAANVLLDIRVLLDTIAAEGPDAAQTRAITRGLALTLLTAPPPDLAQSDARLFYDLSGRVITATFRGGLPELRAVDLARDPRSVTLRLEGPEGPLAVTFSRARVAASNPHQLLVLMLATSALMTLIAFFYLRNQLRPIKRMAEAAEAFGKGRALSYSPSGATEVRAAGHAFLDMRARLERQIEQRTLMLSGVSHDLRTPLTRMKLALSLEPEGPEQEAMLRDVVEMEAMIEEFLAFARDQSLEEITRADPLALAAAVVDDARRGGQAISLRIARPGGAPEEIAPDHPGPLPPGPLMPLRVAGLRRALANLMTNAARHGKSARLTVSLTRRALRFTLEDDGKGIPEADRAAALRPFVRLDAARNRNDGGGGVGLGLSIAQDVAHAHGGSLNLGTSSDLGGLQVDLVIPR
ncbi:MAG: HAMP domain-containing protein [Rhodobacteraceae bacterium]|nr:HAMP domain-containing protein [Paracoccaceae bacterium]